MEVYIGDGTPRPLLRTFNPGRLVITPEVACRLRATQVAEIFQRHCSGDWGKPNATNDHALTTGDRLISEYFVEKTSGSLERVWIITEADRSGTTILLPEEY